MPGKSDELWVESSYAPNIPYWIYIDEKSYFSRVFIEAISYGIVAIFFFRCMGALFNPTNNMNRWLAVHAVAMFLLLTIHVISRLGMTAYIYIERRETPVDDLGPSGLYAYPWPEVLGVFYVLTFPISQFLTDGLLWYRFHVIYSMNWFVTAFPLLIYIGTIAAGMMYIVEYITVGFYKHPFATAVFTSYYSITLALNVILTFMIIIRLALHKRNMRNAIGPKNKIGGLYQTIILMLVESFSIYAVALLLYISLEFNQNFMEFPFVGILTAAQAAAPLLIILRVSDRKAVTSNTFSCANVGTLRFKSYESTGDEAVTSDEVSLGTVDVQAGVPEESSVGVENRGTVEEITL